ncbi:EXLDI protein [Nocardia sp. NPDC049220]|uniref:EXLDI protein n=1 Tax=Nocardia sp. NPDC049220 TaxID=3155273 RepID=UPI0033E42548
MTTDPKPLVDIAAADERVGSATGVPEPHERSAPHDVDEIVLRVGPGGGRRQRFFGRLLGRSRQYSKVGITVVRVYVSRKGKFVVHRQESTWRAMSVAIDWTHWRELLVAFGGDEGAWGDYAVEIVDSPAELRGRIPEHIYRTVVDVAENPGSRNART